MVGSQRYWGSDGNALMFLDLLDHTRSLGLQWIVELLPRNIMGSIYIQK